MRVSGTRTLLVVALLSIGLLGIFDLPHAKAQQANLVRIQLIDEACTASAGTVRGTPAGDNNWSSWATDGDGWDPDCVRLWLDNTLPQEMDVRFCIQVRDDTLEGTTECTPWASDGGGWSDWSYEADKWAYDDVRIKVDSRTMTGRYISNFRLGFQNSMAAGDNCASGVGTAAYTPYMNAGGGWGPWAPDALSEGSIACSRINLSGENIVTMAPVPSLAISVNGGAYTSPSSATISPGDSIALQWSATNVPTSCTGTNFTTTGVSGTQGTVTEPTPGNSLTYTVTCSNAGGSNSDSIVVNTLPNAPITTLSISVNGGAYTSPSSITINPGDNISLQWSATNAPVSCIKTSGPSDFDVAATSGTDSALTEPSPGSVTTFAVSCNNAGGVNQDSIAVTTRSYLSCSLDGTTVPHGGSQTFYNVDMVPFGDVCSSHAITRTCTDGSLSGSASYNQADCIVDPTQTNISLTSSGSADGVRQGGFINLVWNGGNSTSCSVTGIGSFISTTTPTIPSTLIIGNTWVQINGKTVFTFTCSKGATSKTQSATINVIPVYIET